MNEKEAFLRILELSSQREANYFYKQFQTIERKKSILFYIENLSKEENSIFFYYIKILNSLGLYPIFIISINIKKYFFEKLNHIKIYEKLNEKIDFFEKLNHCFTLPDEIENEKIVEELSYLCNFFKSDKLVFFAKMGGIFDGFQKKISLIYLREKTQYLLDKQNQKIFDTCKKIIYLQPNQKFNISVTSTSSFLKELFTIKGEGTLIRKGSEVLILEVLSSDIQSKVKKLIEEAFQKRLKYNFFGQKHIMVFFEENYRGCAVVVKTSLGFYLSKFAVNIAARGDGIGIQIWKKLKETCPNLFWRSKKDNLINQRYIDECDGFQKKGGWYYFWFGNSQNQIVEIIKYLEDIEIDFEN